MAPVRFEVRAGARSSGSANRCSRRPPRRRRAGQARAAGDAAERQPDHRAADGGARVRARCAAGEGDDGGRELRDADDGRRRVQRARRRRPPSCSRRSTPFRSTDRSQPRWQPPIGLNDLRQRSAAQAGADVARCDARQRAGHGAEPGRRSGPAMKQLPDIAAGLQKTMTRRQQARAVARQAATATIPSSTATSDGCWCRLNDATPLDPLAGRSARAPSGGADQGPARRRRRMSCARRLMRVAMLAPLAVLAACSFAQPGSLHDRPGNGRHADRRTEGDRAAARSALPDTWSARRSSAHRRTTGWT